MQHRLRKTTESHICLQVLPLQCSLQRNVLRKLRNGQPLYSLFLRSSAAVTGISTVGIYDNFTSGKTCITVWSTDHETAGWLMKNFVSASTNSIGRIGSNIIFFVYPHGPVPVLHPRHAEWIIQLPLISLACHSHHTLQKPVFFRLVLNILMCRLCATFVSC